MINFRYHLISIVAVFLALGIGLLVGSSVVDNAVLDRLNANIKALNNQKDDLQEAKAAADRDVDRLRDAERQFANEAGPVLLDGRLKGVPVLVLAVQGVSGDAVDDLEEALVDAGARTEGVVWFTNRLSLSDAADVATLSKLVGAPPGDVKALRTSVVRTLAQTLADAIRAPALPFATTSSSVTVPTPSAPTPTAPTAATPTVVAVTVPPTTVATSLPTTSTSVTAPATTAPPRTALVEFQRFSRQLADAGFLDIDAGRGGPDPVPGRLVPLEGTRLVVISGDGAKLASEDVALPFIRAMTALGAPLVVAEMAATPQAPNRGVFVGAIRDDANARKEITTVDNAEEFAGRVATVLALAEIGQGRVGLHYGHAKGRDRLLPSLATRP